MTLITILIALVVQRFGNMADWFKPAWFETYVGWLRPALVKCNQWSAIAVIVLPVFTILGIFHYLLSPRLFGLFYLVLASFVLLLCLDARNLKNQLNKYFEHAEKEETEAALNAIADLTDEPLPTINTSTGISRCATRLILEKSYVQIFSVLFWFGTLGIFGIYGVAGYTTISLLRRLATKIDGSFGDIANAAASIKDILDWLPVRVLGFSYALVGQFMNGFSYCSKNFKLGLSDNMKFTVESGLTALGVNITDVAESEANLQENYATLALIDRALAAWIIAMALITFGMLL